MKERNSLEQDVPRSSQKHRKHEHLKWSLLSLGGILLLLWHSSGWAILQTHGVDHARFKETSSTEWRWQDLKPSISLNWQSCYGEFECARLEVPLDWLEPSNETRAVLAVIRLRATEVDDYKGPVFINPGGPGGSGVQRVLEAGKAYQTIIGRNHDIISFDPRGVGATFPRIDCWKSINNRRVWSLLDVGTIDSHTGVLYDAYARSTVESDVCAFSTGGGNMAGRIPMDDNERRVIEAGPARFVSTVSTARDMLEILDKTGWPRLRYWGFSYGTVLGGVFAAMFPDRVERLISDGNVNYDEWFTSRRVHFMEDADKIMDAFYHFCHLAGPTKCKFYEPTPAAIASRLTRLLESLRHRPVTAVAPQGSMGVPEMVFFSNVKRLISSALYRPILMFPRLATVLAALEQGDAGPFVEYAISEGSRIPFSCKEDDDGIPTDVPDPDTVDAFRAIMCTDGPHFNGGLEEFVKYAEYLQEQSKAAGAVNVLFKMTCAGWKVPAKWQYEGPIEGNPYQPMLFIGNTADVVTPLRSARSNAAKFNGSALLIQNSYGHASISAPSMCTAGYIREYFQNGTLPASGTVCEADAVPFGEDVRGLADWDEAQLQVSEAMWQLAMMVPKLPL